MKKYIRGLIVREPWITYILKGKKKWEIRKQDTKIRGYIALVLRKMLRGFVYLKSTRKMWIERLKQFKEFHLASDEELEKYAKGKKELYIWELERPIELKRPIKIEYPRGAQTWVKISLEELKGKLSEGLLKELFQGLDTDGKVRSGSKKKKQEK